MFIIAILVAAGSAIAFIWPWYVQGRKEYRRLVDAPRLTVRALNDLRELPEWVVLEARTGAGTVTAPLSSTGCAWYQVTAGRTRPQGDAGMEFIVKVLHTATSPDSGIPLVDPGDPETVVWLRNDLADKRLGYTIPTLTTLTVNERIGIAGRSDAAGWLHLRQLQADGHVSVADLALGVGDEGLTVVEETAPADTPVLVLGKPEMRDIGIVLSATPGWRTRLEGVSTWPDSEVRRRFAFRVTVYRRLLMGAMMAIVLICGGAIGWSAIFEEG
ncbi:hypothetical protein DMB66_41850 [Actinoplanes sp. ATCC 53533]|uniref:hypothetical protein n=1 Tax=Actinoplanes sp. ATCC 53533 TaxID=1288362 RepID=UPI000F780AB7|nr:hypothetical protein [Actinoplanes sp. ATCC 53533]RSM51505.1 hypothetical protein DMB66_41850 [Actinoplanes sp. ATCC 53533]